MNTTSLPRIVMVQSRTNPKKTYRLKVIGELAVDCNCPHALFRSKYSPIACKHILEFNGLIATPPAIDNPALPCYHHK